MARLEIILALSVAVLFCGCGEAPSPTQRSSAQAPSAPQTPPRLGNWQFTAASTVPGKPPITFAGSLGQAGAAVNGAFHVDGSNCFDRSTTIGLTSTVTKNSTTLTSTDMEGQVITFIGNFADTTFNGTYKINGGCAAGEQGSLTGVNISNIGNTLSGSFMNAAQKTFNVAGEITQSDSANSDGSFPIAGTGSFDTPCFSAGTIQPGTFSAGSFMLGESMALVVETSKSVLTFLGTLSPSGSGAVIGNYEGRVLCLPSLSVRKVPRGWLDGDVPGRSLQPRARLKHRGMKPNTSNGEICCPRLNACDTQVLRVQSLNRCQPLRLATSASTPTPKACA